MPEDKAEANLEVLHSMEATSVQADATEPVEVEVLQVAETVVKESVEKGCLLEQGAEKVPEVHSEENHQKVPQRGR